MESATAEPVPCLHGKNAIGSFEGGDGRVLQCVRVHDMRNRLNKSLSFDPDSLVCTLCARGGHPALMSDANGPIVLVGTDQCFPACTPSKDNGECMRTVRVEDGSLQDIMYALADTVGNAKLAEGTVILLGSVSYLGEVGTAQYLTDWCKSRWWLKNRFGEGCHILPLMPVPSQDIKGTGLVRSLLETLTWFESQHATETILLRDMLRNYISVHIRQGTNWDRQPQWPAVLQGACRPGHQDNCFVGVRGLG